MLLHKLHFSCIPFVLLFAHSYSMPSVGFCSAQRSEYDVKELRKNLRSVARLHAEQIRAPTFSEDQPVSADLFGNIRSIEAGEEEMIAYQHPRIVVGDGEWQALLTRYADRQYFGKQGSWSQYFRKITLKKGPFSSIIATLSHLETNGSTSIYDGRPYVENCQDYESYRKALKPVAELIHTMTPLRSISLFLCAFWADVAEKTISRFLGEDAHDQCINAIVGWAKILLAHRAYFCNPVCVDKRKDKNKAFIWNALKPWDVNYDYYSAGSGLALAYDVLYSRMAKSQQETVRSAIALLVLKRYSWGNSETTSRESPNAISDPHRIMSNWALYHSSLYLINLAIEGETGFDRYTTDMLSVHGSSGFNHGMHTRFSALIQAYMAHAVYPDGSTFEDGNTYFYGLREGSLALVASHRRGSGVLGTARFRNFIHNAGQMNEPWQCGKIIGHGSGGGSEYNTYLGLFKYAYPDGELPDMLWRQQFGKYQKYKPCGKEWWQTTLQLAFLGGEHHRVAKSPEGLSHIAKKQFKLSYYATRRGLLIARNSHSERSSYLHFDARPDAFFPRHDNADRGTFTFSSLGQTWLVDCLWKNNSDSRKHNIMHVDGLAQAERAPSVRMLRVTDNGRLVLAAADLTYAYNTQWAAAWNYEHAPHRHVTVYDKKGFSSSVLVKFESEEKADPWQLGWPEDDGGEDIGLSDSTTLHGVETVGFKGLWTWKRRYRVQKLNHIVRSVGLLRSEGDGGGIVFIVDSVDAGRGAHIFESYLILNSDLTVEPFSNCRGNSCTITVRGKAQSMLDIHVYALSQVLNYRIERLDGGSQRLVVRSTGLSSEEMWLLLHPRDGGDTKFSFSRRDTAVVLAVKETSYRFEIDDGDHGVVSLETPPMIPFTLKHFQAYGIGDKDLCKNKESFLHRTNAPLQSVFAFSSFPGNKLDELDEIRTCNWYTRMTTKIAIYDCGDTEQAAQRYMARQCHFVSETGEKDICSQASQQSRWSGRLQGGHVYYVAISGHPIEGVKPRFSIVHLRRRAALSLYQTW